MVFLGVSVKFIRNLRLKGSLLRNFKAFKRGSGRSTRLQYSLMKDNGDVWEFSRGYKAFHGILGVFNGLKFKSNLRRSQGGFKEVSRCFKAIPWISWF